MLRGIKLVGSICQKVLTNYNVIINRKNFYDQPIDSDIKRYQETNKTTTGQGKDYTTGYLSDYDYLKNYYRLIAVDLSWRKVLDTDPKAIQYIEFDGQLKKLDNNGNATEAGNGQSMFILKVLQKMKERNDYTSQASVMIL